jgi:protoheme IX farnesyltransferase
MALGVAALNQYQERHSDSRMERTSSRPIPAGIISEGKALQSVFFLLLAGSLILWWLTTPITLFLGLLTVVWYNAIYTPLKRKSAFAAIPGGVCGALPPMMGWTAAGGELFHPKIIILALFFFVWQIPHFWLILLKFGEQYSKAGLPSITDIWDARQLKSITFIWMLATGVSALLLPAFNMVNVLVLKILLVLVTLSYVYYAYKSLYASAKKVNYFLAFMAINLFLIGIMLLLVIQQFWN